LLRLYGGSSMKTVLFLLAFSLSTALVVCGQDQNEATHAPDGRNVTRIQNITIPPLAEAPFSAIVSAELTRPLADGNMQVLHNSRIVARDSVGRVYQERRRFVSNQVQGEPALSEIDISDPLLHRVLICYLQSHQCMARAYYASAATPRLTPAGPLPGNRGYLDRIGLGKNTISGLDVVGTRETTTYFPGVFGNQREMSVVKEIWYSPQLGVNLSVHRSDPLYGTEDFTVSNISLAEPDPSIFSIPQGYRLGNSLPPAPVQPQP